MPTIGENLASWDDAYDWEQQGEEWSGGWGTTRAMWFGTILPRIRRFLPCEHLVEIAPGFGRVTEFLLPFAQRYSGVDLAERCVAACRQRFAGAGHASFHVGNGRSLGMLEADCVDFAFSWDSLVHADLEAMRGYVAELQRVLRPGGSAFLHHSNLAALAPDSPAVAIARKRWRDQTVSAEAIRDAAREAGIHCVAQELVQWACHDFSDAFTLLHKPAGAAPPADPIVAFHPEFDAELQHFGWLESLYGELRARPEGARRRAGVLLRAGRRDAALEELQRLLRLTPGDVEAATWAATLLRQTGRLDEAEPILDAAIRAAPRAPALLRERAWLRHEQDRFAEGLADARAAEALLEPPPGDEHACVEHALSVLLDCAGDVAGALEHVGRALELRPREASLLAHRAALLQKLGRSGEARAAARAALRSEPLNEIARRILAAGEPLRGI